MTESDVVVLEVGHPARSAAARALLATVALAIAFTTFAVITTHVHAVRSGSPWQDDPYDLVVSFTQFLVPALSIMIVVRMWLCRRKEALPLFRISQLLRAAAICTALVAATVAADWIAVATGSDRAMWNGVTPVLVAALAVLTAAATAFFLLLWHAFRLLPRAAARRSDGDWIGDAAVLLNSFAAQHPRLGGRFATRVGSLRVVGFVRRRIRPLTMAAALLAGLLVTGAQAVGEGWSNPALVLLGILLVGTGVYAFSMICNSVLQIALPRPMGDIHRAMLGATTAAAFAVPVAIAMRDTIWAMLGGRPPVNSLQQFVPIISVSVLIVALLVFAGFLALSALARRFGAIRV